MFVKIEPFADESKQKMLDGLFLPYGYTHDTWPLSSTATYVIDLQPSFEKIVENFKSKFRYNLRLAEKNGLKVKITNGKKLIDNQELLRQFTEIYNNRAKEIKSEQHSFSELLHMCKSFGEKLWMIYVEENSKSEIPNPKQIINSNFESSKIVSNFEFRASNLVMASFFLQTKDILHYWHNGSTLEGRKLFAPTLVISEGIKLGQKLGCKIFEFEGIYDERFVEQTKRWKGFTKFKEGFNGERVIYAWPYIKFYSPVFRLFHFFRMI